MKLIEEAIKNGLRHAIACDDVGIDVKTFKRWKMSTEDKRKGPTKTPGNKLTDEEVSEIVRISTRKEYVDLAPTQIVPSLADKGIYIASESSFYKILKKKKIIRTPRKSKTENS